MKTTLVHIRCRNRVWIALLGMSLLWAFPGCEQAEEPPEARALTAIAWLEPDPPSEAIGRVTFINQETGVDLSLEVEALEPGPYRLRLRPTPDCEEQDAGETPGAKDLAQLELTAERYGKAKLEAHLEQLDLESDGPLVGGTVVIHSLEALEADPAMDEPDGSGSAISAGPRVACGQVELVGMLLEDSEGRWQGPRPTP